MSVRQSQLQGALWQALLSLVLFLAVFLTLSLWQLRSLAADQKKDANPEPTEVCMLRFSNGSVLEGVPLAKTLAQQAKGLTKRKDAGPGLLFSWNNQAQRVFWMRDTYIPLSIGFMDKDGLLFAIEDMEPESDSYHISSKPAADALELGRGQFQRYGLGIGDRLIERRCRPL